MEPKKNIAVKASSVSFNHWNQFSDTDAKKKQRIASRIGSDTYNHWNQYGGAGFSIKLRKKYSRTGSDTFNHWNQYGSDEPGKKE